MTKLSDVAGTPVPEYVEINGLRFKLGEFDMRTRGLWVDHAREYGLEEAQRHLQSEVLPSIATREAEIRQHPEIRGLNDRYQKLLEKHQELMEVYGAEDEPDDIDDQIDALEQRMLGLSEKMEAVSDGLTGGVISEASEAERAIADFMELQDKAKLHFVYKLASASDRVEEDFEDFEGRASANDYEAADRFLRAGNAGWEARMRKATSGTSQKNRTGTNSTAKLSQPGSNLTDSVN